MIIASPRNTGKSKILDIYMIKEINNVFRSLEAQDEDSVVFKKIRKSIVDVINNNMNYIDGGRNTGIDG